MRNDILFGILITLLQKGKCTYQSLADRFEVSKRTIQRYCLDLEMSGIPTVCSYGRNGGIEIMGTFNLNNMFFTKPELQRLLTHLHASPLGSLDNLDKQIEEKLVLHSTTNKTSPHSNIIIDYNAWSEEYKLSPIIKLLNTELGLEHCYNMTYTNSSGTLSTRVISPYKFIFKDSKWYLFAHCHKTNEPRIFKINRIQELLPTEDKFIQCTLTDDDIKSKLNNLFDEIELTLEVSECAIADTLEWLDDHNITHLKNGNAIITGTATNSKELIAKIISNHSRIKLLSPESLLTEVRKATQKLNNLYL